MDARRCAAALALGFAVFATACGGHSSGSSSSGSSSGGSSGGSTGSCAAPCGTACCTLEQACIDGACCSNPCGDLCCQANQACLTDPTGRKACGGVSCGTHPPDFAALSAASANANANTDVAITTTVTDADNDASACPGLSATVTRIAWSVVSAPPGSHPVLVSSATVPGDSNPSFPNPSTAPAFTSGNTFRADVAGTYVVEATAYASNGASAASQLTITVGSCGANAPVITAVAVADANGAVSRPPVPDALTLTASHTDADDAACAAADAESYFWTLVSAPAGSAASLPQGAQSSASVPLQVDVAGTYVVSVVAQDSFGLRSDPRTLTLATGTCGPQLSSADAAALAAGSAVTQGSTATVSVDAASITDACVANGSTSLAWSFISRPAGSSAVLASASSSATSFQADVAGAYALQLVVTDSGGYSTVYQTLVTAGACTSGPTLTNPTASYTTTGLDSPTDWTTSVTAARGDIFAGDLVQLATPDGFTPSACSSALTYQWSMLSRPAGSQAQLSPSSDPTPAFVADVAGGTWQLELVLRDGLGNSTAPFFFSLTSSTCGARAPVLTGALTADASAHANEPFAVTAPTASDANADGVCPLRLQDGSFSYAFQLVSGPGGATATFSGGGASVQQMQVNQGGTYAVQVTATSARGLASAPLSGTVAVSNDGANPPVTSQFILSQLVPGNSFPLTASVAPGVQAGSFFDLVPVTVSAAVADADTVSVCKQSIAYAWTLSAPAASHAALQGAASSAVQLTPDTPGSYTLTLTTTDNCGYASASTVSFDANCGNSAPTLVAVTAAPASPVSIGAPVALDAQAADADVIAAGACGTSEAQPLSYRWSFAQRPAGSAASLLGADTEHASFVPDVSGIYRLQVAVTDPQGHTTNNGGSLTVDAECGTVAPYVAPASGSVLPEFAADQALSLNGGALSVVIHHDSSHASDFATSLGAPATVPFYPGVPVQLSANVPSLVPQGGSCPAQSDVISYRWSIVQQPAGSTAALSNPTSPTPSFTPDLAGAYAFSLVLTDQNGRSSTTALRFDDVGGNVVSVGSCGLHTPTLVETVPSSASVGASAQLDAAGSQSPDDYRAVVGGVTQSYPSGCGLDLPLSYTWALTRVPAGSTATIAAPAVSDPSFVADVAGAYTVQLTATDGRNSATHSATFNVGTSAPGAGSSTVFTATAIDPSGHPVVAWWDNASGSVSAARCTANCSGASPTWTSLGPVDTGLAPMTFAANDEPRPIAVAASGSDIYVAYFTSTGTGTAGAHGLRSCDVALATYDGSTWHWNSVTTAHDTAAPYTSCTAAGTAPFSNYEFGRWLSMALSGSVPVIAYWSVVGSSQTELEYSTCSSSSCSSTSASGTIDATSGFVGRWSSLAIDGSGTVHAAYYVDNDGSGNHGLRYATNATGSFVTTNVQPLSATSDLGRFAQLVTLPATSSNGFSFQTELIAAADVTNASANVVKVATCSQSSTSACNGGGWSASTVADPDGASSYGRAVALAVDANGLPRMAYLDLSSSSLRLLGGQAQAPLGFTKLAEVAAQPSPGGVSAAFSNSLLSTFVSFNGASGPQVLVGR